MRELAAAARDDWEATHLSLGPGFSPGQVVVDRNEAIPASDLRIVKDEGHDGPRMPEL